MIAVVALPPPDRMTLLCGTFPTLDRADGVHPFDPELFDEWTCGPRCHGAIYAGRFILAVWSGRAGRVGKPRRRLKGPAEGEWAFPVETPWRSGPFDVVDALGTWDGAHRAAFAAWAQDPWWP